MIPRPPILSGGSRRGGGRPLAESGPSQRSWAGRRGNTQRVFRLVKSWGQRCAGRPESATPWRASGGPVSPCTDRFPGHLIDITQGSWIPFWLNGSRERPPAREDIMELLEVSLTLGGSLSPGDQIAEESPLTEESPPTLSRPRPGPGRAPLV